MINVAITTTISFLDIRTLSVRTGRLASLDVRMLKVSRRLDLGKEPFDAHYGGQLGLQGRHDRYCTASATSSDGWPLALTATTMYWVPSTMYVIGRPL